MRSRAEDQCCRVGRDHCGQVRPCNAHTITAICGNEGADRADRRGAEISKSIEFPHLFNTTSFRIPLYH